LFSSPAGPSRRGVRARLAERLRDRMVARMMDVGTYKSASPGRNLLRVIDPRSGQTHTFGVGELLAPMREGESESRQNKLKQSRTKCVLRRFSAILAYSRIFSLHGSIEGRFTLPPEHGRPGRSKHRRPNAVWKFQRLRRFHSAAPGDGRTPKIAPRRIWGPSHDAPFRQRSKKLPFRWRGILGRLNR